ncbi:MAG: mannitol dehydrogenase family protein [Treponema sp.]|jgi:fructuronate reductase|nr:mannitol dehydrogenase family protein [Treponema sp.]
MKQALLLSNEGLRGRAWKKAGIGLPDFDREAMIAATNKAPEWIHFGAGNIFRAFPAALWQALLEKGLVKTGVVVAEGYDGEIIDRVFAPYDNLSLLVTLKAGGKSGKIEKKVIASVARALRLDRGEDLERVRTIFRQNSLKMASFTITEKGYALTGPEGALSPRAAADMEAGPLGAKSYMGVIAALCHERYLAGEKPLALVSMDNCSHNGDRLFAAVDAFAQGWAERRLTDRAFAEYIRDRGKVSFPWTMIDKITPRPSDEVKALLVKDGLAGVEGGVTAKGTYAAPFVNAEECQYLVIEDSFPAGRPPLEKAGPGVFFTERETVDRVEKMKVCTCLNPLHTALALFGCLLGYTRISDEMKDKDLRGLLELIGRREGLPVVTDPGIISPRTFLDEVLRVRLPNPYMPDTPQRIAVDTSLKMPIRFGETLKAYQKSETLRTADLEGIPLVAAAWFRYLLGVDDWGNEFTVSPDPQYDNLANRLSGLRLGAAGSIHETLGPVLSDPAFFGVDLYEAGLGVKVENLFARLVQGPGAVRAVLKKTVSCVQ